MIRRVAAVAASAALLWGCEGKKEEATMAANPSPTAGAMTAGSATGSAAPQDSGTTMLAGAAQQMATADAGSATTAAATPASAGAVSDADRKAADEIFAARCVTCHGAQGKGDGPAAAALNPKPRAFGDAEWQKSVTDEHIEKVIAQGGPAVGKSPLMPPNPDLAGKPVVQALREKIRGFGGK